MNPKQHQIDEWDEQTATGDLLVGADPIHDFLVRLGMHENVDPYYLKRTGDWPIGNTGRGGGKLIASKRRLIRHIEKITRGRACIDQQELNAE